MATPGTQAPSRLDAGLYEYVPETKPVPRSGGPRTSDGRMLAQQVQPAVRQVNEPQVGFVDQFGGVGVRVGEGRNFEVAAVHFPLVDVCPHRSDELERNAYVTRVRDRALKGCAKPDEPRIPIELVRRHGHRHSVLREEVASMPSISDLRSVFHSEFSKPRQQPLWRTRARTYSVLDLDEEVHALAHQNPSLPGTW